MAAITATHFTITISERLRFGKKKRNMCILTLGTEGDTYEANGLPLPTYANWGLHRNIDYVNVYGMPDDGLLWKYFATDHTLAAYRMACGTVSVGTDVDGVTQFAELATDVALTTRAWYCEAVGW